MKQFRFKFPWEDQEYEFRTDVTDFVEVSGHTKHNGSNVHKLLRKVERLANGVWEVYPTVVWVDGKCVHGSEGLFVGFLAADGKGGIDILLSPDGVPDGELMLNAEKAGIHTATYDF